MSENNNPIGIGPPVSVPPFVTPVGLGDVSRLKNLPSLKRHFTQSGRNPEDMFAWEWRQATIHEKDFKTGKTTTRTERAEFPASWSQNAVNIVASKYFRVVERVDGRTVKETSMRQVAQRLANTISLWAGCFGHLSSQEEWYVLHDELVYMILDQRFAFNSPVWFNVGTKAGRLREEQTSACFILGIEDNMDSILEVGNIEGKLYKGGSGSGINYSPLRSSREELSGGGTASGPVPFIAKDDANAGAIKSGGTTRRAAKMAILNADHGDIFEFVRCKSVAETMAQALIDAGFDGNFDARFGAYQSVPFQNANHSVRVSDAFMTAVEADLTWDLRARDGSVLETVNARELWNEILETAWRCGDPGLQFDDTCNRWHTLHANGRNNSTNPCQPAWATVLTPEGIRTFADIDVGSTIWSGKRWTKVVRKIATGVKPVLNYHTRAGVFVGTAEHQVLSKGERVVAGFAETIDTAQGRTEHRLDNCFDLQTVIDGLVLGDGSYCYANDGNNTYSILYVGDSDQSYFTQDVSEFINSRPYDGKAHRVKTTLQPEELPKTYLRSIPKRFLEGDRKTIYSFLRGLYSANGSVVASRVTLKAASFSVIKDVQQMLSAVGIKSYYTTNHETDVKFDNGTYTCRESYDLNISTDRGQFLSFIGFIQPYKQEKLLQICSTTRGTSARGPKTSYEVVAHELLGEFPVWDIEVEADEHTYWTGGLLVSNCSEYVSVDNSACNLASLNLRKFQKQDGTLNIADFVHAVDIVITAMDALVDGGRYPTEKITKNASNQRQLGLGYANLGAFLMYQGIAYDSAEGCRQAAAITALMTGRAYERSAQLAQRLGPFKDFENNRKYMLDVLTQHNNRADALRATGCDPDVVIAAKTAWQAAVKNANAHGVRNSQATVLAPTGTIAFAMDCDTTGIEPDLGIVKTKNLVGGGSMKIINQTVPPALNFLGYSAQDVEELTNYAHKHGSFVGSNLKTEHLPVFDTALADPVGKRSIMPMGHVRMMAAVQPFLSGAISKTVNLDHDYTPEQIGEIYFESWKMGVKCIAVYRDGCKRSQPLSSGDKKPEEKVSLSKMWEEELKKKWEQEWLLTVGALRKERRKLPDDCRTMRHKFQIGGHKGYLHMGLFDDGTLGEIFIKMSKEGSTISGLLDAVATLTSYTLQYGIPLDAIVRKFKHASFEPAGWTGNKEIPQASSVIDYVFRVLENRFLKKSDKQHPFGNPETMTAAELRHALDLTVPERDSTTVAKIPSVHAVNGSLKVELEDATGNVCPDCGNTDVRRTGSCKTCGSCGWSGGCG